MPERYNEPCGEDKLCPLRSIYRVPTARREPECFFCYRHFIPTELKGNMHLVRLEVLSLLRDMKTQLLAMLD